MHDANHGHIWAHAWVIYSTVPTRQSDWADPASPRVDRRLGIRGELVLKELAVRANHDAKTTSSVSDDANCPVCQHGFFADVLALRAAKSRSAYQGLRYVWSGLPFFVAPRMWPGDLYRPGMPCVDFYCRSV